MPFDELNNWYLDGTTLHPTPEYLRSHVTALSEHESSTSLTITFTDSETLTFSHTQLSVSTLHDLTPFTTLNLPIPSESFHKIRDFVYCTPVDLSSTPLSLIKAAHAWQLSDLFHACFLVVESAPFHIVQIIERCIPLAGFTYIPDRFVWFVCARVAVDARKVLEWMNKDVGERCNRVRFAEMVKRFFCMKSQLQKAMLWHSEISAADVFRCDENYTGKDDKNLFWVIQLAELVDSNREYYEGMTSTKGASASVEVKWGREGAALILGLQDLEGDGVVDVSACAIGLGCGCGDSKHNEGWKLEGGAAKRCVDWTLTHEIVFKLLEGNDLREWRETHENCAIRVKIRIVSVEQDEDVRERDIVY